MQITPVKIGDITLENNVFFAPLAGYTNYAFRRLCKGYGAGLCYTEMVSAKGLKYGNENTQELLYTDENEGLTAAQIFGNDPEIMRLACEHEALKPFPIVDINMGCPVPKIFNNGEGSALMKNLPLASKVIKSAVSCGKPVTVKFRTGITDDAPITRDFALMAEDSGASLITIHGRSKKAVYAGECNYAEIEKAKNAVKIPVIANGGIFTETDADIMIERTGADGVMIARGALENPLIFCDITKTPKPYSLKECILKQVELNGERYGDERGAILLRKQMAFYLKGAVGGKKLKEQVFACKSIKELKNIILNSNCF